MISACTPMRRSITLSCRCFTILPSFAQSTPNPTGTPKGTQGPSNGHDNAGTTPAGCSAAGSRSTFSWHRCCSPSDGRGDPRGVTHIPSICLLNCKPSWAAAAAPRTAERRRLSAGTVSEQFGGLGELLPAAQRCIFPLFQRSLIFVTGELVVLCLLTATIHLPRDARLARPLPLQAGCAWSAVHMPGWLYNSLLAVT